MSKHQMQAQEEAPNRVFWLGVVAATVSVLFLLFPDLPKSLDLALSATLLVGLFSVVGELRKEEHTPRQ